MIKKIWLFLFEGKCTFNLLCCLLWGRSLLHYFGGAIRKVTGIENITADNFTIVVICIALFFALPELIRRIKIQDCLLYLSFVAVYLLQFLFYPDNTETLELFFVKCCLAVFPFFLYGKVLDIVKMEKAFSIISYATILVTIFYFMLYGEGSKTISSDDYDMGTAYALLPYLLFTTWQAFRNTSIVNIVLSICGFFFLLGLGTRGPVLAFLFPLLFYIFILYRGRYAKTLKLSLFVLILGSGLLLIPLTLYLTDIFETLDISTRILDKIIEEELDNDSGRGDLIMQLDQVRDSENRLWGYGLFGSYNYIGIYPHNIFYEFIFSFGVVLGGGLIVVLLYHFYSGYRKANLSIEKEFITLFVLMELIHLCFSYTFMCESIFFLLIGYCSQMKYVYSKKHYAI